MRNQMYFFPSIALTRMTKQTDDLVKNQFDADTDGRDSLWMSHQCHTDLGNLFCITRTCKFPGEMFALRRTHPVWHLYQSTLCFLLVNVWYVFVLYSLYCPLILTFSILKKKTLYLCVSCNTDSIEHLFMFIIAHQNERGLVMEILKGLFLDHCSLTFTLVTFIIISYL